MSATPPFDRFDFDLGRAVLEQLIEKFEGLSIGPMAAPSINSIFPEQGVYQLFMRAKLVYAGKTSKTLPSRLLRHHRLLSGRKNITLSDMGFKAVVIHRNWMPSVHERLVIDHYTGIGFCEWNATGFGNNDPGRRREDTIKNRFDLDCPINESFPCAWVDPRTWNVLDLLISLKQNSPFLFRYQCDPKKRFTKGSVKYNQLDVVIPKADMTIREILSVVVDRLPAGWQATFFPSHVILYEEPSNKIYQNATIVIRKP